MKSIKTLSLILVASTLIPASAHAWSWGDVVKPASAVTTLVAGRFLTATGSTRATDSYAREYNQEQDIKNIDCSAKYAHKLYNFICEQKGHNDDCTCHLQIHSTYGHEYAIGYMKENHSDLYTTWKKDTQDENKDLVRQEQRKGTFYHRAACAGRSLQAVAALYLTYNLGSHALNYATNQL